MACFLAPAVAAIITTSVRKKVAPQYHLEWLNTMLWGGVVMLIVDHLKSGELILYPPFLTADLSKFWSEILKAGVPMTLAIVLIWIIMVLVTRATGERKIQIVTK